MKKKRILIALDYNPSSQKVAEAGFELAKLIKAEVSLLHVIREPLQYSVLQHVTIMGFCGHHEKTPSHFESIAGLRKISTEFLEQSKIHLGDPGIYIEVREGDIAECILKSAKEMKTDYIVLGSSSRRSTDVANPGNIILKVLHLTPAPLIIIPTK